jgi:hypothetical protein
MFYASEMFRYNSETQYKTLTGGILSIGVIVTIVIAFFSMIQDTLNRTTITYTLEDYQDSD